MQAALGGARAAAAAAASFGLFLVNSTGFVLVSNDTSSGIGGNGGAGGTAGSARRRCFVGAGGQQVCTGEVMAAAAAQFGGVW